METRIVADASCELPAQWLADHGVLLMPIGIRVEDQQMNDVHDPVATLEFYTKSIAGKGVLAESVPLEESAMQAFFLNTVATSCDYGLCLTVASSRSPIFERATEAGNAILQTYKSVREAAGRTGKFSVRVLDTGNMFAGQGALTAEAARMLETGASGSEVRAAVTDLIPKTWCYLLPSDLYYVRARAKKKGDGSVGIVKYALGTTLNIRPILRCNQGETGSVASVRGGFQPGAEKLFKAVATRIEAGGTGQHVVVSYGGAVAEIAELPGFGVLAGAAQAAGVELITATMSMTAGVNVGGGGLSVGLISDEAPL